VAAVAMVRANGPEGPGELRQRQAYSGAPNGDGRDGTGWFEMRR
jgi:hypothetical protein